MELREREKGKCVLKAIEKWGWEVKGYSNKKGSMDQSRVYPPQWAYIEKFF
jgi:hypothetical protein